jgi:hypothetical protein
MNKWIKKQANADNTIDMGVDIGILCLDILAAPILIPVRIGKFLIKKFLKKGIKFVYHLIHN